VGWVELFRRSFFGYLAPTVVVVNAYIVVEDRSVIPECPCVVDLLHRSAGGVLLFSLHSWSIHRLLGRPGRRFQLWSGRWPRVRSTWHWSAWWAGVSSESLAMWPKTDFRRRVMRSDTGPRPVRCDLGVPDVILLLPLPRKTVTGHCRCT